jgi:outer membrane immunogenic protein
VVTGITPAVIVNSADKVGVTVGGGLETALSKNWFARAEYRYADFGTSTFSMSRTSPDVRFASMIDTFGLRLQTHTAMFGIACKFDWGSPIIAKY